MLKRRDLISKYCTDETKVTESPPKPLPGRKSIFGLDQASLEMNLKKRKSVSPKKLPAKTKSISPQRQQQLKALRQMKLAVNRMERAAHHQQEMRQASERMEAKQRIRVLSVDSPPPKTQSKCVSFQSLTLQ